MKQLLFSPRPSITAAFRVLAAAIAFTGCSTAAGPARISQTSVAPVAASPDAAHHTDRCGAPGSFEVKAAGDNAVELIEKIVAPTGAVVRALGCSGAKVTLHVCATSVEDAVARITRACGLSYRLTDGTYHIAPEADLIADLASDADASPIDTFYRCRHLDAVTLVDLLKHLFQRDLVISTGPQFLTPAVQTLTGVGGVALPTQATSFHTHDVVFSGPTNVVKRAIALARKLDRPRKQVRISVQVTDVSSEAQRQLGLTWEWGKISITEDRSRVHRPTGDGAMLDLKLGRFERVPINIHAVLSALEEKNQAHLLTNAHLVLLDGERSYVLTGSKYVYPKVVGTNSNGMPVYDTQELKVGIYIQVAVQVGLDGDIVMSVYPQVSALEKVANFSGWDYPVVATREQQTTVTIRSGQTLAIGGLRQDGSVRFLRQVPYLGAIPLVGKFFQYHDRYKEGSELVVLITPELID